VVVACKATSTAASVASLTGGGGPPVWARRGGTRANGEAVAAATEAKDGGWWPRLARLAKTGGPRWGDRMMNLLSIQAPASTRDGHFQTPDRSGSVLVKICELPFRPTNSRKPT